MIMDQDKNGFVHGKWIYRSLPFFFIILSISAASSVIAQCNGSIPTNTNLNFTDIVWSGTGCVPPASGSYTGDLNLSLANNSLLIIDMDMLIDGNFTITNSGSSTIQIPAGITLEVTGDLGDSTNNNVSFIIDGILIVGGTLYGKNNNLFEGSGIVDVASISFKTEPTCDVDCNITWFVANCEPMLTSFCNTALPIDLVFFNGINNDNMIKLNWTTTMEENFDYFIVERSLNAVTFYPIGKVGGKGIRQSGQHKTNHYIYYDTFPVQGINYYRLKSVDLDGSFEYHKTISINFYNKPVRIITSYPNPVTNTEFTVRVNFPVDNATIELFNCNGILVYRGSLQYQMQKISPGIKQPGIYILKLNYQNTTFLDRLVFR